MITHPDCAQQTSAGRAGADAARRAVADMEIAFGRSFASVRLLVGGNAAHQARRLGARAFATGRTVVLPEDFDSNCLGGRWLLAHELAHILQQENGCQPGRALKTDFAGLEAAADSAADIVAAGGVVPVCFDLGTAPFGAVQCHTDQPCPGTYHSASEPEVWRAANAAIEQAYLNDPRHRNHSVFLGSEFDDSLMKIGPEGPGNVRTGRASRTGPVEVMLPKGVKEKRFGNLLLRELRGIERQRRPDIIDFTDRVFYEIKSTGYADRGQVQLNSYYKITEAILINHGQTEPPWKLDTAPLWYPPHVLPIPSPDPRFELIVCTQDTDQNRYPGLILYEVHRLPRRRRRQRTAEIQLLDFQNVLDGFRQPVKDALAKGLREFDPSSPDYVVIVPDEFLKLPIVRKMVNDAMEPVWDRMRVQPEIARRRLIVDPRVTQFWLGVVCIVGASVLVMATAVALAPVAAGVGVGAGVTTGTGAGVGAGAVAVETTAGGGLISTIVVPASVAARVAGTTATAAEVVSLVGYNALLTSSTAKAVAATAGVILVLGTVENASASTGSATASAKVDTVIPFRALPVNDFVEQAGTLHGSSTASTPDVFHDDKQIREKFSAGAKVMYDNRLHWVLARIRVR